MGRDAASAGERQAGERSWSTVPVGERRLRAALLVLGLGQLGLAAWQAFAPGNFFRSIGGFGQPNIHYLRDTSTFYAALGVVLLLSVRRPRWRVPVLSFATLQYLLHFVNHVVDIGKSRPSWVGPADAISIGAGAILFAMALLAAGRARRHRA